MIICLIIDEDLMKRGMNEFSVITRQWWRFLMGVCPIMFVWCHRNF